MTRRSDQERFSVSALIFLQKQNTFFLIISCEEQNAYRVSHSVKLVCDLYNGVLQYFNLCHCIISVIRKIHQRFFPAVQFLADSGFC